MDKIKIEHIAMYVNDLEAAKKFLKSISTPSQMKNITTQRLDFSRIFFRLTVVQGLK